MPSIFVDALPFLPVTLAPAVFLLLAPFVSARARTIFAALLLVVAVGFLADILLIDHGGSLTLEVPNVFFRADTGQPHEWIVAHESAPAWAWHLCVTVWFGVFGAMLWLGRHRVLTERHPVVLGTLLFLAYLAVRLALEKCAAHKAIVWATGSAPALVVLLPFVAWHAGRRGYSLAKWAGALLVMALLQRLPLIVFGYFATTRQLGTHLDTHVVTDMQGVWGKRYFAGDPVAAWFSTTFVPHTTLWIGITLALGLILGFVPWWRGRQSAHARPAA